MSTTINTLTTSTTTKTTELVEQTVGGITFTGPKGGATIEQVPVTSTATPKPKMTMPTTYSVSLDAAAKANINKAITDLLVKVSKGSATNGDWVTLGAYYKMAGDYKQAESAWLYVTATWSTDRIAHGNLGDLYAYYLKNPIKAEAELKTALSLDKTQIQNYRNLYDFYVNIKKDTAAAKAILNVGITANPNTSAELKTLLETL
jgi:tetratricopeptide (TPR) repeat protein